ncbi:methyl-accepting chemotaxis protein [Aliivibrio kagoshimensis]|uniref:methyl-accepting chemotaxis protein n=1 Tax=Aliivibrio kagoshimensis TaxID=2910230 RepID=UPI003D13B9E7
MFLLKKLGFKQRIIFTVALLISITLLTTNWLSYNTIKNDRLESIENTARQILNGAKQQIEASLASKVTILESSAAYYKTDKLDHEYVDIAKIITNAGNFFSFTAGYQDGRAYGDSGGDNGVFHVSDYDPRTRGWYKDAMQKQRTIITDIYQDDTTGELMVSIATPAGPEGIVTGDISLNLLNDSISSIDFFDASVLILNQNFVQLASTDPSDKLGEEFGIPSLEKEMAATRTGSADYQWGGVDKRAYFTEISLVDNTKWFLYVGMDKSVIYSDVDKALTEAIWSSAIIIFISLFIVVIVLNQLYRPITVLNEVVHDLSKGNGDLTRRLPVDSHDELGQISQGINHFIENLQTLMLNVSSASSNITVSVDQLNNQTATNNQVLSDHSSQTLQIVTAIEEMSVTANDVANNASEASHATQLSNEQVAQSKSVVLDATVSVSKLVEEFELTSESITEIEKNTLEITSVLQVIGDIAAQTNLLALNAAIEAARAGEQGRGFAVVADEVRALAARTQTSTAEIAQTLARLRDGSSHALESINATKNTCERTVENTNLVADNLDIVVESVTHINDVNTIIATAAEEQSAVAGEITTNMSAIRDIVNTLSVNGEATTLETQNLTQANEQLKLIVNTFKLS